MTSTPHQDHDDVVLRTAADCDNSLWRRLTASMDGELLGKRLMHQAQHVARMFGAGPSARGLHLEELPGLEIFLTTVLRCTGLRGRGRRNALNIRITRRDIVIDGLPDRFDGLRIAHLSDLHLDGHPGFGSHVAALLRDLDFDLCLLTGDYRFLTTGSYAACLEELQALAPALRCRYGAYGILGNHDFAEFVPHLEDAGVHMLLNRTANLGDDDAPLWLAGMDDIHFYGTGDLDRTLEGIPGDEPAILMVHSPELLTEASDARCDLYLCGHTHAGQICLPGGLAPITNARTGRCYAAGAWRVGPMQGYTSAGTGSSGVFARFNCPPEIAIHVLRTGGSAGAEPEEHRMRVG